MNRVRKFIRPLARAAVLALLGFALSTNVLADNYRVIIKKISTESATGDIIVRIKPGKNEKDFTGSADVMLVGSDIGASRALATLLTAVSVGSEIIIDVPNPPSLENIQAIISLSLIAP